MIVVNTGIRATDHLTLTANTAIPSTTKVSCVSQNVNAYQNRTRSRS
jgi:hypothetical protein